MDTTGSAAAAAPARDGAAELGDLLVHLEGARGCFSGSLIDYRMPCTASEDTRCQIVASIPLWNEFLCWLKLELRELTGVGRQLGLVHVSNICYPWPTDSQMRQAAALLYWLLKTHRCVELVQIPNYTVDLDMRNLCSAVLCTVLNGNDYVKSLTLKISYPCPNERACEVVLSMKRLEELRCEVSTQTSMCPRTISALLRASSTLTVLHFNAPCLVNNQTGLLNALKANTTLRDLTLCFSEISREPESFVAFLSGTVTLKHLRVVAGAHDISDNTIKWIFQGMLKNSTVSSLEAHEPGLDGESVRMGARMLAQSKVLRSFGLWGCLFVLPSAEEPRGAWEYTDSWLGAMSKNDTLQHITLSVSIWTSECWEQFFRVLSRHRSLKMATIVAGEGELCRLSDIAKKLEKIGCEEKVSFVSSTSDDRFSLADCKNYSELRACVRANAISTVLTVYRELATFPPLTFLSLEIRGWVKELCRLLAVYVCSTSTLQRLDLQLSGIGFPTKSEDWWLPFSGSLLRNRSVTNLGLGVDVYPRNGFEYLGAAVARSKTIRELRSLTWSSSTRLSFLRGVRAGISENYALCSVALYPKSSYEDWEGDWSFVCDTARRNSGYVARTAQFLQQARCDTPCAAALDRVYRHPALVAELSKVLAISEADAVVAVRQHFRSIEGMHEFMRLAGVVKVHVTCLPRDDGRPQLNALDEYCWAHVRRYLQLDDVAWYCQSSTDAM